MKVGDIAPNFKLNDENGKLFELYQNLDSQVLIVFYSKDDTPVCSSQLSEYNHNLDEFLKNGIKIVGINADTIKSHIDFCNKLKLKFPLLADEDRKVSKQYGALNIFGINKRILILVGIDKKVLWIAHTLSINFIKSTRILEKITSLNSEELT
jgi:thioredoxin-dependent peroxiredoxin